VGDGLYSRAILCPPHLFQTYTQFKTFKSTREFINSFDRALVFIWKNDGTKSWKLDKRELSHIEFKIKKGKQLKGTEAAQSREITLLMRKYRNIFKKNNYETFTLIPGHCDLCAFKCPNRDNPPCKMKGFPSLEAIGIDVYKLLEKMKVAYEYPCINYLTSVTMTLIRKD